MEKIDNCFPFLQVPRRPGKPRSSGLTTITDADLSIQEARNLVESSGELIDYVKFTGHASLIARYPVAWIKEKLGIYHANQIKGLPSGASFEVAAIQNQARPFMERARELGFDSVEISDGLIPPLPAEERISYIKFAREIGLEPFTEVGRKDPTTPMDVDETIATIRRDLDAGAKNVTIENSDVALLMKTGPTAICRIVEAIGVERLVFEVGPSAWPEMTAWVIRSFGPEVNLENVRPAQVSIVDGMRRGMHRFNFDFITAQGGKV